MAEAPVPVINRAIRRAAMIFCIESEAIRETLSPITVVVNQGVISLPAPSGANIIAIHEAKLEGVDLSLSSARDISLNVVKSETDVGVPTRIYLSGDNEATLSPYPEETVPVGLSLRVSVAPTFDATAVPTELLGMYFDALMDGAVGELYTMRDVSWENPQEGKFRKGVMLNAARRAKGRAEQSGTRRSQTVKYGGI